MEHSMSLEIAQILIRGLYTELIIYALILEIILFFVNIGIYKRKWKDHISLMLIFGILMSTFEIVWPQCNGRAELRALSYIGACGYSIAFLEFAIHLNLFLSEQFGWNFKRKWIRVLLYYVPVIVFTLLCAITPWNGLVYMVDANGVIRDGVLTTKLYYPLLWCYFIAAFVPSVYYFFASRKKASTSHKISRDVLIFGAIAPGIYFIQFFILGSKNNFYDYYVLCLATALPLVYLTTVVNTRLLVESQAQINAVEADMQIAAKIQMDALPPTAPVFFDHTSLTLRATMVTAKEVGGDFYDYFFVDENRLCFLIADVSGKGTPAALFMMTAKTVIKDYAMNLSSTSEIFTAVNTRLCESNKSEMFATAWIGLLDLQTMTLQYTNAGHNYPLLCRNGSCQLLTDRHGLILAAMDGIKYSQSKLKLEKGDRLLIYTDGITEAHNSSNAMYGEDRLIRIMEETSKESCEDVLAAITEDVNRFANDAPQFDDMTMEIIAL